MNKAWLDLLVIGLLIILSGCLMPVPVPGADVVSPEISGRVIDGETKMAVAGAKVAVLRKGREWRPVTVTDNEGRFHLPKDRRYYLMRIATPSPVYRIPPTAEYAACIEISHPGYETLWISAAQGGIQVRGADMGDIEIVTRQ
ncbi:MAG TPA: carboxypeptidase-like regulatory domain-containing protein [Candidatus Bathyarchaeia archaeon]|nr:carboxypeptidase-like regulatory domain-containing protein [Candidatus Bathyarchaeia archaeon]